MGNDKQAILIVDDNPTNIQVASNVLKSQNFTLGFATSGEEALQRLANNRYDLILLDVMMPGMDGFETCKHIRQMAEYKQTPIIFVTAKDSDEDFLEGFYSGGVDYVTKPYSATTLTTRVNTHLMLKSYRDRLEERVQEEIGKRLQQERLLARQSKQAAMGEMIGHIAHQWKQPLNILGLIVQDLPVAVERDEFDAEYLQEFTRDALKQIHYMSQTIDDFRSFFRPDKEKVPFDVKQGILKTYELIKDAVIATMIKIDFRFSEQDAYFLGYPNEFSQVVLNLVSNAKDALTSKSGDRLIVIEVTSSGGKVKISVTDNAGGVPEDIIERIFEPYFTTKEDAHGTGLGLYMSKTIIEENLGGKLSVHNTSDGACFEIELDEYKNL